MEIEKVSSLNPLYREIGEIKPRKADLKKEKIIQGVINCIAGLGIENTTFEAVGRMTGMRKSHVAYYFPSRDKMIQTTVRYVASNAQHMTVERIKNAKTWEEQVLSSVEGAFDWFEQFPEQIPVITLLFYFRSYDEAYIPLHDEIRKMGLIRLHSVLKQKLDAQGVSDRRSLILARNIQSIVTGVLIDLNAFKSEPEIKRARRSTIEAVEELIRPYLKTSIPIQ